MCPTVARYSFIRFKTVLGTGSENKVDLYQGATDGKTLEKKFDLRSWQKLSPPEGKKSEELRMTEMTASTGIGPPKQGHVLTVLNPGKALVPLAQLYHVSNSLCNCANGTRAEHGKDVYQGR